MADRTTRTSLRVVAGAAVACLALAGCGATTTTSTSTATATSSPSGKGGARQEGAGRATDGRLTSVAIIGDSLTYQFGHGQQDVTASLVDAGWPAKGICWSGADGRTTVGSLPGGSPSSLDEVKRCRKQLGGEPQLWVLALETNDLGVSPAEFRRSMTTLLDAVGPEATVLWVNAGRQDPDTKEVLELNPVVADVVESRPNTHLADWYSFLKANPDQEGWWREDGTHLTRAGFVHRNTFVAQQARAVALG